LVHENGGFLNLSPRRAQRQIFFGGYQSTSSCLVELVAALCLVSIGRFVDLEEVQWPSHTLKAILLFDCLAHMVLVQG